MTYRKLSTISLGLMVIFGTSSEKVLAHGVLINYHPKEAIEIQAKFENGNPMTNAQVVIYSPNNPNQPWLTSTTDDEGKLMFFPDYSQKGDWTVKVRSAGHGDVLNIPIELSSSNPQPENSSSPSENKNIVKSQPESLHSSPTMKQKLMMALTGVWGFVGTALFFSRKK
ncbi:hypothetical protein [Geminocystis sp. NIES-3709]|uniref:hypothetical protein n=1 Tax=Geminocystis sp. NIES-3709 TaxID=1617448 RepID=UPI0005FCD95E|nr:hypothetical protein [Geminocystis sp. NIES-3709]BAQ64256.1 hypothetical protein GM3709_1021 [Geminocystis sp. NIES-3709]